MDKLDTVGNWNRNPSDLTIKTGDKYYKNVTGVWRNQNSGDVIVIIYTGVGGDYTIYHIPEKYINSANQVLKKLYIQDDSVKYKYGAVINRTVEEDAVFEIVEQYMMETDELDE